VVCAFWAPWSLVVLLLFGPAILLTIPVLAGARGKLLIPVLAGTGMYELGYGLLLWLGLSI
jgi:1,4-dihydroxy-2-naphthoate octaprenyltransferase